MKFLFVFLRKDFKVPNIEFCFLAFLTKAVLQYAKADTNSQLMVGLELFGYQTVQCDVG